MKKVKFIYNPRSGDNRILYNLDEIIAIHQDRGYTIVPYRLVFDGTEEEVLAALDDTYHHVLIAGGDGTINHIINIMKRHGVDTPVAVLPTGTANDFARLMNVPTDVPEACREILNGHIIDIDLGVVNGRYFVNVFSSGLFTDVSQKTPTVLKNTFGKLAYYMSGLGELPNFRKMQIRVEADGEEVYEGSAFLFFVFNGKTAGNFRIAYLSDIQDGLLDVLIVKAEHIVETIRTVAGYLRRPSDHYPKEVLHVKSRDIRIYSRNEEATDMDGEAGPSFPLHITCDPGSLKVLAPKIPVKKRRKFNSLKH